VIARNPARSSPKLCPGFQKPPGGRPEEAPEIIKKTERHEENRLEVLVALRNRIYFADARQRHALADWCVRRIRRMKKKV